MPNLHEIQGARNRHDGAVLLPTVNGLEHTQICQHSTLAIQQAVERLQVIVHNAGLMQLLQARGNGPGKEDHTARRELLAICESGHAGS